MDKIWVHLSAELRENLELSSAAEQYSVASLEHEKYVHCLVKLYEKEMQRIDAEKNDTLSSEQKNLIQEEICHLSSLHEFKDIRKSDIGARHNLITPDLFNEFVTQVKENCPLIDSIFESIVSTATSEKNVQKTNKFKFKCATHALAGLMHIRSSKASTDFSLLFGLLSISYGAGKQFVNLLNTIGLSLHWDTM